MRSTLLPALVLAALAWASPASADLVSATAIGNDAQTDTDFWTIRYIGGSNLIKSISIDLSPIGQAFDFDGSSNYLGSSGPVIGATSGIVAGSITPSFTGTNPAVLTFDFAADSFDPGDWFSFSADFDGTIDNDSGSDVAGALFTVELEDGETGEAYVFALPPFQGSPTHQTQIPDINGSLALVQLAPEPGSLALAGVALLGLAYRRRRRRNAA